MSGRVGYRDKIVGLLLVMLLAGCGEGIHGLKKEWNNAPSATVAPPPSADQSTIPAGNTYQVQRGDTLYAVARRANLPVRTIIDANGLQPPYQLTIGQRLIMPRLTTHTVENGETLFAIARRYNVEMTDLVRANNLQAPYAVKAGQQLVVPTAQAAVPGVYAAPQPTVTASPLPGGAPVVVSQVPGSGAPGSGTALPVAGAQTVVVSQAPGGSSADPGSSVAIGPVGTLPAAPAGTDSGVTVKSLVPPPASASTGSPAVAAPIVTPPVVPQAPPPSSPLKLPPQTPANLSATEVAADLKAEAARESAAAAASSATTLAADPKTQVAVATPPALPAKPAEPATPLPTPDAVPEAPAQSAPATAAPPVLRELNDPPPRGGKTLLWPVRGRILATFGEQAKGLQNDGINIAAARGTPIRAAENGVVAYAGNELRGFGNLLLVRHADGLMTAYAHADQLLVQRGDVVRRGQTIAKVGSTGAVTEPQIHFEVRKAGTPVDPEKYLGNPGDALLIMPDDRILRPDLG